jgi:hypothetical protein
MPLLGAADGIEAGSAASMTHYAARSSYALRVSSPRLLLAAAAAAGGLVVAVDRLAVATATRGLGASSAPPASTAVEKEHPGKRAPEAARVRRVPPKERLAHEPRRQRLGHAHRTHPRALRSHRPSSLALSAPRRSPRESGTRPRNGSTDPRPPSPAPPPSPSPAAPPPAARQPQAPEVPSLPPPLPDLPLPQLAQPQIAPPPLPVSLPPIP